MSTLAARAEDMKIILRGLLVSSPHTITVDQLERDFRLQEGQNVPFRELGYPTFLKYLESIPDTVVVCSSPTGGCPLVVPVQSDKSAHIDSMVQKQKLHPPKRLSRTRRPAPWRSVVNAVPQMSSAYYNTNYNSSGTQQRIFVPVSLQQRIRTMILENPKGVPVQTIEREFLSSQTLKNYGLHEGCDIHQLLSCLDHLLKISNGMVYPLHHKTPPYRPIVENPVTDNQISNIHKTQTYRFIPAGCEAETDEVCNQNGNVNVGIEFSGEISKEDDADIVEALHKQTKVTEIVEDMSVSSTRSVTFDTEEALKVSPDSGSPSDDTRTYTCDITSDLVGEKMKMNFQTLLDKHPNGIWCSELPVLYKKEFAVVLEYANLGFASVIHMASNLPDVFHCIRPDGTDWKLFDARKKLPPEHAAHNIKCNKDVSTKMVPRVPSKIRLNMEKLLADYPSGVPSELIPHLYKEEFMTTLNVKEMGFESMETFLLVLHDSALHLRYVNKKILVYPLAREAEPETDNPFPHITEPQDNFLNLYPPEVVGPKGTLTHEKIPPEATPGGFIEVLVAEIYTPLNFWVQLRGENTHRALDTLMNDMQQFYVQEAHNYKMPDATVRIGQYCVAPYNEEWHRACVTAVHNFFYVQVLFVDYGTSCKVKKNDLRFMHMDFSLFPIQAIKASLANLVAVGGGIKWPHEASVRFLRLVMDKNLIAIVSSVDHEARKLEVALVDTTGDDDIHINDVLVSEGLAEYKTNRPLSPLSPQPKRIDGDPVTSTITVSRPPPGFTAARELRNQPLLSPTGSAASRQKPLLSSTGSAAPRQSTYVPEMPGKSHLQTSLPTLPMANTIPSTFKPQPTDVPRLPVVYEPLLANTTSLAAQSSVLQQLALYENFLQQQQLIRSVALLVSQNMGAASLVNPFMVPLLNPAMIYSPIPVSERITNVGGSGLGISEVPSPQKNTSEQISPSDAGQLVAAANVSTEDCATAPATSSAHTETKEPPSVTSSGVSRLSVVNSNQELCAADVHCNEQPMAEANTVMTEFSAGSCESGNILVADSCGLTSESDVGFESQYVNEGTEPGSDLSTCSDEIYRSDDDDDDDDDDYDDDDDDGEGGEGVCEEQNQPTLQKSTYVKQIEIAGRVIHLIKVMNTVFLCTEELVRHFSDFSGRHVVLKILDARGVKIPFCEIGRKDSHAIIDDLESYDVVGVLKSPGGYIIGKVHLTPLASVTHLIPLLNVEVQQEFYSVVFVECTLGSVSGDNGESAQASVAVAIAIDMESVIW